ncbi:hypothetical protein GCM10009122_02550 [Fulvivirga kasyanovii]|uniref:PrgI family protein n=1 Tax=Fulvivirga kasyanovii TaxID=396812 RepID=A0ABW9RK19_9BACT|nr:hypothetical protein [Fulvivirga kasyanovii]MTI24437.1 hypothetical protein [Fulvivirga kasyanovii]
MKKIDLVSGRLFPWYFQLAGGLVLITGIAYFQSHLLLSLALFLISILVFTGYSGIEIDPQAKTYRPYYSFLFLKTGKRTRYAGIDRIYINANQVSQRVFTAHTNSSTTFKNVDFDAYIKFNNGVKEYIMTKRDKNALINKLKSVAEALDTPLVDNS